MPCLVSPPGFNLPLALNWPYPLITGITHYEWLYVFLQGPQTVAGSLPITLGVSWHLSNIGVIPHCLHNSVRTLLSHQPQGLGWHREVQKQCHLSPNPDWGMCSGGQIVWPFHNVGTPYQARAPTMEEGIKQLTPLLSTAHHVPLPREGHPSILVEGGTSSATCRRVS